MNPKGDVTLCSWYSHSRKPYRKGFYCSAILSLIGVRRDQSTTAFKIAQSMVFCCLVKKFNEAVEAAHNNHVNTVQTSYLIEHVANLENRMQAVEKNMAL